MQLRILKGYQAGNQLELQKKVLSIGREEDNDFVVPDPEVSRHHCLIAKLDREWTVQDLHSRNGVSVNGRKINGRHVLRPGDEITIFTLVLKFEDAIQPPDLIPLSSDVMPDPPSLAAPPLDSTSSATAAAPEEPPADVLADARLPNPLELIIPIAKFLLLMAILIAIAVLLYLLTATAGKEAEQAGHDEAQSAQTAVVAASVTSPTKPENPSGKHARGERLIENADPILELGGTQPIPPPPVHDAVLPPTEHGSDVSQEDPFQPEMVPLKPVAIVIRSIPTGANVSVNGQFMQQTPAVLQDLEDEQISVELELPGYEPKTIFIKVEEGSPQEPIRLVQKVGTLRVESKPPGALVSEGRIVHGTTPILLQNMMAGTHELLLEHRGYESQKLTVNLTHAKGETIRATLKQTLGTMEITSIPPNCRVFLDGVEVGVTESDGLNPLSMPLTIKQIMPGQCTIKILHPETGAFDTITATVPSAGTARCRALIWIPTHQIVLADNTTLIGMLLQKTDQSLTVLTAGHQQRTIPASDYVKINPLSNAEQNLILTQRAKGTPSGQFSTKSKLSITAGDFLRQANVHDFREYVKSRICITGSVTMRMKTPRETVVHFGRQIRCILAPTAPKEDYKKIGQLEDAGKTVSLRGTYEGKTDQVFIFSNCVLLPYPD